MLQGKKFQIRLAEVSDIPDLRKLINTLFPSARPSFLQNDHFPIALLDGHLVGFAHIRTLPKSTVFQGLGVHPTARRLGVGRALSTYASAFAAGVSPHAPMRLKVKMGNAAAIAIYLKQGFMLSSHDGSAYNFVKSKPN